jgi:hypothetical protein
MRKKPITQGQQAFSKLAGTTGLEPATFPLYERDVLTSVSIYIFFFLFFISFSRLIATDLFGCSSEYTSFQGRFVFVYFDLP